MDLDSKLHHNRRVMDTKVLSHVLFCKGARDGRVYGRDAAVGIGQFGDLQEYRSPRVESERQFYSLPVKEGEEGLIDMASSLVCA